MYKYYDNNENYSDENLENEIENNYINSKNDDYYINKKIINNNNKIIENKYNKNIINQNNAPKKKLNKNIENDKENKIEPKILFPDIKIDDDTEINKFLGLYDDDIKFKQQKCKNDWKHCDYCEKRHGKDYFLKNVSYCILCWSWLNVNDLDLETGEYTGEHNFDDIKAILLKTYQMYNNIQEKNPSSIYIKIKNLNEAGILHTSFKKLLGFEQEKKIKQEYLIYNKSRKLNINYEKSILEI
jgi:hypothetical protein